MRTNGLRKLAIACQLQKLKVVQGHTVTDLPQNMMMPSLPKRENTGEQRNENRGPDCRSGGESKHNVLEGNKPTQMAPWS